MKKKILVFTALLCAIVTFAQAPGDDCATATVLGLIPGGTISTGQQSTAGYTDDFGTGNFESPACIPPAYGGSPDGVYEINVTNAGDYTFEFTTFGTIYKSLTLHDACPPAALPVSNCIGGLGTATDPNGVLGPIALTPGTYYIIIDGWTLFNGAGVNFELEITSPISNDSPCTATSLPVNGGCIYTLTSNNGASDSGIANPGCANYQGGDVWFEAVIPAGGAITIDTLDDDIFDSGMAVYSGTCGSLTLIECDDDDSNNGLMSSITLTGRVPGETIFIRFWEYGNDTFGDFGICVSEPPPPTGNDDCSGAIELNSFLTCYYTPYTTEGATASTGVPAPGCANYQGGDVWFSYVVNSTGQLTIDSDVGDITDGGMAVYSGICGALTLIECDDDDSANGLMPSITLTGRTPGETLYIRFWEYGNNDSGVFDICITSPVPTGTFGVTQDCPGEPSLPLISSPPCAVGTTSLGLNIAGSLNAGTDPVALQPIIFIDSTDPCTFDPTYTSNYTVQNFTVTQTGTYVFAMDTPTPYFDAMGYIVVNDGLFVPGSCATGTYIAGDDDDGPALDPQITATLTAGVNYSLITCKFAFGATTHTGPFNWVVTPVPSSPDWYTTATGGTSIGTGIEFNPVGVAGSGLPDTNTPGVYSFWAECSGSPGVRYQADYVIGKIWDGSESSSWMDPLNWYGDEIPDDADCVYIPSGTPNDPVVNDNDDGDGLTLTIENNATLNLTSDTDVNGFGASLTIQDYIEIQGTGSLVVQDDASLIQVYDATTATTPSASNSGNITLRRNTNIRQTDYVFWSTPVETFDVSNVYGGFTPTNYIFEWIPTVATGTFAGGGQPICYGTWNPLSSGNMSLGKGYIVRGPTNHTAGISTATATFTGVPNNGVITQTIGSGNNNDPTSYTYNPYGGDVLTVTEFDDNWNLLGNPYPSALDAQAFLTYSTNSIIEGAVHIWTHGTEIGNNGDSFYDDYALTYDANDYTTYNFSGTNTYSDETFAGQIASGQGFFVLALNDNEAGSVTFNNSMRDRSQSNTAFYRSTGESDSTLEPERHRIWLNLISSNGASSSILVAYLEGATQEKDRLYDAYARDLNSLSFYSRIGNEKMLIQGRSVPFDVNDQVRLGTVIPEPGQYTIAISGVDGLFENESQNIFLEDTYTNTIYNLRQAPYLFEVNETIEFNDRFILRYTDETLGLNELEMNGLTIIAPDNRFVKIKSELSPIAEVLMYDLLGRVLYKSSNLQTTDHRIENSNLAEGAYIVKATLSNGLSKTQKVVLKH